MQTIKTLSYLHSAGKGAIFHTIRTMGQFASNRKYSWTHIIKTKSQVARTRPIAAGFRLTDVLLHRNIAKYKLLVLRSRTQGRNSSHVCKLHCYGIIYRHVSILYSFIHSCLFHVLSPASSPCNFLLPLSVIRSFIKEISSVLFVFSVYASASFHYMTFVLTLTLHSRERRHFPIKAVVSLNQIPLEKGTRLFILISIIFNSTN